MLNVEKTWIDYLAILNKLDKVVKKQTILLENKDFNNLNILFGQKENAYLSLQMVAGKLAKYKDFKKPDYSKYKSKARALIQEVQKSETFNKDLLVDLIGNTKQQSNDLKKYSTKCKTYLSSVGVKQNVNLNVVS